ncbi:alkaline phosphatase family protein [Planctomycetota bacterium]
MCERFLTLPKILMIEIDGLAWDIINPLIKKNRLPNIGSLIENGSSGVLKSLDPILSPIIWTSIVSGKAPDKHGINGFFVNSNAVTCKRIWDIFTERGIRCGIFGHLVTWPPPKLDCFAVPDFFASGTEAFPPDLSFIKKIAIDEKQNVNRNILTYLRYWLKCLRYGVGFRTSFSVGLYFLIKMLRLISALKDFHLKRLIAAKMNSEIFAYLHEKTNPDFSIFYTNILDSFCHVFWKFMEPEKFDNVLPREVKRYGSIIPAAYQKVDCIIGNILSKTDKNTTVVVLSDHGFKADSSSSKLPLCRIQSSKLLDFLGLSNQVIASNIAQVVYIRVKKNYHSSEEKVIDMLKTVRIKEADAPLFNVHSGNYSNLEIRVSDEAYEKLQTNSLKGKTVVFNDSMLRYEEVILEGDTKISGTHHEDGVLIMKGPHIRKSHRIHNAHVFDVVPTLLALSGMEVASDMDGKILTNAIEKQFLHDYPIQYIDTYESPGGQTEEYEKMIGDQEKVILRLRELGYID